MNKSILSWVLGISLVVVAPVAMAERGENRHDGHKYKQKHAQVKKHNRHQSKKFVKAQTRKKHHSVKHRQPVNDHYNVKKHGWTFSVSNHNPYRHVSDRHYYGHDGFDNSYNNHNYRSNRIYERQANQKRRIRKGIHKNQLARFEVRQLRNQQRRIANRLEYFRSDGRLSRHERNKIHKMLDRASNNIRSKRHNRYVRDRHFDSEEHSYF